MELTRNETAKAVIEKAIKALPKTSQGIARSLRQRGITGYRYNGDICPLRNYLKAALDKAGINVDFHVARFFIEIERDYYAIRLPSWVSEFIFDFDSREQYEYLNARKR